ncbi:transcriptional regulator [Brevundimonas sp.]|jgi:DNA-binding winged helix-turn-helix (wHTH) protein|uniref:winged helix-turn-helix domain-containing protein n=1 Tax=Brevundimonas sp. TaxID=1871086 RepID=UPI002E14348B|nr:transcriptional regulator [Brevundimonas sp.]
MTACRFDRFRLDPQDRRLTRDGETVEISGRYLDALALLVAERGRLVTKDRFMDEVWKGVPVTDEALTQCVRALRRELGDDAARPRFIETVPKHGYRFVAEVTDGDETGTGVPSNPAPAASSPASEPLWRRLVPDAGAGMTGGGLAGVAGGLFYGLAAAPQGMGGASTLIVLVCATTLLALAAGASVGLGVAAGRLWRADGPWGAVLGGALGGALVGGLTRLIALDAFRLLTGVAPADMTGAGEGLALGAAAGLGAWLATRPGLKARTAAAFGGAAGAAAGLGITLLGGRLLGGSLDLLLRAFPEAPLSLAPVGRLIGEDGFGPVAAAVTATLEGALFAACVALATALVRRQAAGSPEGAVGASGVAG